MSTTRASTQRTVRQKKLNTKQPLRIIREHEVEEQADDEQQKNIPQLETGVEKGEEGEYHLQAVLHSAKAEQSFIPTPVATRAQGVQYDDLYPRVFAQPATNIRFSSTVEDCIGVTYCMNEKDARFLQALNKGKGVHGQPVDAKSRQCSEDVFEEAMNFFEETSQHLQPYANVDGAPLLSLEEMERDHGNEISLEARAVLKPIYQYWALQKGSRPLMAAIKVRVLDTTSEADDADPYICFRRREVRQTRKTRGRDVQVVEKLKKLRLEVEQGRTLGQMVRQREDLNKLQLETTREVFDKRRQLKEVKIAKNIVGEKGDDEDLLINQKPISKPKARQDTNQQRPATIRLRSIGDRTAPDNDLVSWADLQAEVEAHVTNTIDSRKQQHKRWNERWQDRTWHPLTPPPDPVDQPSAWAPLSIQGAGYPTPPPSLQSRSSQDRDGDVEMKDTPEEEDASAGAQPEFTFFIPPPYAVDFAPEAPHAHDKRPPICRIRRGRGGRQYLEQQKPRPRVVISSGVVSDADSDDEEDVFYPASETMVFDYRCATSARTWSTDRRSHGGGEQSAGAQAGGSSQEHR